MLDFPLPPHLHVAYIGHVPLHAPEGPCRQRHCSANPNTRWGGRGGHASGGMNVIHIWPPLPSWAARVFGSYLENASLGLTLFP